MADERLASRMAQWPARSNSRVTVAASPEVTAELAVEAAGSVASRLAEAEAVEQSARGKCGACSHARARRTQHDSAIAQLQRTPSESRGAEVPSPRASSIQPNIQRKRT